ncbi:hypothetical protein [Endozoicomonas atrinae]|uniref:hypothetical protein n=1 Tax=Endozoicomonas atrinae TaxID=1333660 RepID=UPI00082538A3|nr:hypothetical protein [Endozoicomonas atrinae]
MSEISGSGDLQSKRLEPVPTELLASQPIEDSVEKVTSGYDQTNTVSQSQPDKADDYLASRVIPVPTLQPALPGATVAASEDIKGLLSKALVTKDSLEELSAGEDVEPFESSSSEAVSGEETGQPSQPQTTVDSHTAATGKDFAPQLSAVTMPASTPLQDMVTKMQSALPDAMDTAAMMGVYESNVRQLAASIQQTSGAELSAPLQALSVVAANVSPSVANTGSLALQRMIDDIVSINRNSGGASVNGARGAQQNSADLYGIPEHVRLSLLSQRLGIDLDPLIRTRESFLEGTLVIQKGILLSIEAMANSEFLEILKERLREEEIKEDQNKEAVEKLKQAIAALQAGEPKVAAEVLNSASLITTAIEQMVDRYTSDETPGSLRQHLKEHLIQVLDSVTRQGSYQDMMNKRVELLQSARKV